MDTNNHKTKLVPVEVYSRVVGYFRPVSQWNTGKQAEFFDRRILIIKQEDIMIKKICGKDVDSDQKYYIAFPDRQEDLTGEKYREYNEILKLPDALKVKALYELDPEKNPHVKVITGEELLSTVEVEDGIDNDMPVIKYLGKHYVVFFDSFFNMSRRITFVPIEALEFYYEHSKYARKYM